MTLLGAPEKPLAVPAFALIMGNRTFSGSNIGGIAETRIYAADIRRQQLSRSLPRGVVHDDPKIAPLTVITADELELMLLYLSANDATWKELLDARHEGGHVTACPSAPRFGRS